MEQTRSLPLPVALSSVNTHAKGGKGVSRRAANGARQKRGSARQPVKRMKALVEMLLAELSAVMEGGISGQEKTPRYAMLFGQKEDVLSTLIRLTAVYEKLHKLDAAPAGEGVNTATHEAAPVELSEDDWAILSSYISRRSP